MDPVTTAGHAKTENPGRDLADPLLLGTSVISPTAVGFVPFGTSSQNGATEYGVTDFNEGEPPQYTDFAHLASINLVSGHGK